MAGDPSYLALSADISGASLEGSAKPAELTLSAANLGVKLNSATEMATPLDWSGQPVTIDPDESVMGDEVTIDVPAAAAPNGPVIQDGIAAVASGILTAVPGVATLTMTGGTLEVGSWVWWGDGPDSFPVWRIWKAPAGWKGLNGSASNLGLHRKTSMIPLMN